MVIRVANAGLKTEGMHIHMPRYVAIFERKIVTILWFLYRTNTFKKKCSFQVFHVVPTSIKTFASLVLQKWR